MRKLIPISAVFALLFLISMNDYDICSGSTAKAACSACHLGSVSSDVFILDGKTEDDGGRLNENEYQAIVRIPVQDVAVLQLNTSWEEEFDGRIEVDLATTLIDLKENSLFAISDLFQRKANGNEFEDILINFAFDEKLTESRKVVIEGVLANGDGLVDGDKAFYKEVTLEPKEDNISSADLTVVSNGVRYYAHKDVLEAVSINNPKELRVFDLQGRMVKHEASNEMVSADLSDLEKGYYIAVFGSTSKDMLTYKFKK